MLKIMEKSWLSPFLLITYLSTSITGLLMLFHIKAPGLYPIHNWGGIIFIVAGILHLIINWKMFLSYFNKKHLKYKAMIGMMVGLFLIAIIAINAPSNGHKGRNKYRENTGNMTNLGTDKYNNRSLNTPL